MLDLHAQGGGYVDMSLCGARVCVRVCVCVCVLLLFGGGGATCSWSRRCGARVLIGGLDHTQRFAPHFSAPSATGQPPCIESSSSRPSWQSLGRT